MFGFVYSLVVAIAGLFLNIFIYKDVTNTGEVIVFCALIIIAAAIGLIVCVVRYKKREMYETMKLERAGIVLSVIAIVLTLIFMIVDIVSLHTTHFVEVHS